MKLVKLALGTLLIFLATTDINAQEKLETFLDNLVMVDRKLYLSEDYRGSAYVFCVGMSIDTKGQVEKVVFSDKSKLFLGRLVNFADIEMKLKNEKQLFKSFNRQFLVLPIFIMRGDSKNAVNLDEMEMLWKGMISDVKKINRTPVLLTPQFMRFTGEIVIN